VREGRLMNLNGVTCPECGAGFRRLELYSNPGAEGEYRCPVCDHLLEVFSGDRLVVYRLTVQPSAKALSD
jgi:Zn finger protein HypA/HybF involved in hydrogenase expression